jgi:acetyltransferase-like isoleucine patch superfamily enzyme
LGILEWAQRRETPAQKGTWALLKKASRFNFPVIPGLHHLLLEERRFRKGPLRHLWSKIYHEPLLRLQCESVGNGLQVLEDMPKILGNLRVRLGARVALGGEQVWIAAGGGAERHLDIDDDASLGHAVELVVGDCITIGKHARLANRVSLIGYDGHPADPYARARQEPPGPEGVGAITIKDHAWVGSDAIIMKGVTVGRGAIVSMGAVVKVNVPDLAIVSGNPAKVVWQIAAPEGW